VITDSKELIDRFNDYLLDQRHALVVREAIHLFINTDKPTTVIVEELADAFNYGQRNIYKILNKYEDFLPHWEKTEL
jgi:ABC-type uncharacterized transport system ATPase component